MANDIGRRLFSLCIVLIIVSLFSCMSLLHAQSDETKTLIQFKNSLSNGSTTLVSWNESTDPCTAGWVGVSCKDGKVIAVQLENLTLTGRPELGPLAELTTLYQLSFFNNSLEGLMPDVNKLTSLKSLYLSNNNFSGDIPDNAFDGMRALKKVVLAQNQFTGKLPKSLLKEPRLVLLNLSHNQFFGKIPNFPQMELSDVDLSNNKFVGRIPRSLSQMNPAYFQGNEGLCGKPLAPCKSSKKRILLIVIIVASVLAVAAIAAIFALLLVRKRSKTKHALPMKSRKGLGAYNGVGPAEESPDRQLQIHNKEANKREESGKLRFVRNDRERFELHDLLRASAEVLGSGSFGSSYKAVLQSGPAMVVKRFKHMNNVGKEQFYEYMRRLGRLSHPNLLPLVAFYYRKEEKLVISDYIENGSLASHLHANRAPGQPGLDWPTRLKIIKGVVRGLAYLYKEFPSLALPHGHLKSSNVVLDKTYEPLLTDYALVSVINKQHAQQFMVAYKSPEYTKTDRTTRKTDVWSLGILILELLTGKFPANYLKQGKGSSADLGTWVNSVVREEWTGEVFDKDMRGTKNGEGEMLKLLKIGMCCCERDVDRRWDLREAVEKIDDLKERDSDYEDGSSYASEGDIYSSRALTDDDFSFSVKG